MLRLAQFYMTVRRAARGAALPAVLVLGSSRLLSAQAPEADDPPSRVARISSLAGTVSVQTSGSADWSLAELNYSMTTGDRMFSDLGARAELEVGPFTVRIADSTDLTLTNLTDHFAQLAVAQGTLRLSVFRLASDDSIEIDTPNGALTVRGPGHYRVSVPSVGDYSIVTVDDGALDAEGPGLEQTVRGPQTVTLGGASPVTVAVARTPAPTAFDAWSADRDRRAEGASSQCGRYMSSDIPGCADLNQYGRWASTRDYGFVWYPPPGVHGWMPYRYGHWAWVDPWGWVWVEDEPWGFAPFHYGRWVVIAGAWGWVPGPVIAPCYSPALVVFAGGGGLGVGIQAWFPLGPREPYIPWYHYGPRYLRTVNAANVRGVRDIDVFVRVTDVQRAHYVNRTYGFTAVSAETFSGGRRVNGAEVGVRTAEITGARIVEHPTVGPTKRAAAGGAPSPRPPEVRRPPMVLVRPGARTPAPTPAPVPSRGEVRRAPITKVAPPPSGPPPAGRPGAAPQVRRAEPRTVIIKHEPPPQNPPFADRAKAMQPNPGRPLTPDQIRALQKGKQPPPAPDKGKAPAKKKGGGG
jgi:hypothetical protein